MSEARGAASGGTAAAAAAQGEWSPSLPLHGQARSLGPQRTTRAGQGRGRATHAVTSGRTKDGPAPALLRTPRAAANVASASFKGVRLAQGSRRARGLLPWGEAAQEHPRLPATNAAASRGLEFTVAGVSVRRDCRRLQEMGGCLASLAAAVRGAAAGMCHFPVDQHAQPMHPSVMRALTGACRRCAIRSVQSAAAAARRCQQSGPPP